MKGDAATSLGEPGLEKEAKSGVHWIREKATDKRSPHARWMLWQAEVDGVEEKEENLDVR